MYNVHIMLSVHDSNPAYSTSASISPNGWSDRTFPPETRGFLPPLSGELRFRVTLTSGSDLVAPNGVPWNIPFYNIPSVTCHQA